MDISHFYHFGSKLSSSTIQVHPMNLNSSKSKDSGLFDQHLLIMGIYESITMPIVFNQVSGKKREDMLDTGWAGLFLISDRLRNVLEKNKLTGWKTFPAGVFDKSGIPITGYSGFSITGRCGPIDTNKGEIIEKQLVSNGPIGKYRKGFYIGLDEWDKSDIFLPKNFYGPIVTNEVATILTKSKVSNIKLLNLADIETIVS